VIPPPGGAFLLHQRAARDSNAADGRGLLAWYFRPVSAFVAVHRLPAKAKGAFSVASNRILLVEDDPDVRPLLEHILLGAGYHVDVAATVRGAMAMLKRNGLVVTDGMLPDGTGIQIADKAKERKMKTLIVTGYAMSFPKEALERHEYLWKPLRPPELLDAVARNLSSGCC
jgi:CheY-like chemotaxis protein